MISLYVPSGDLKAQFINAKVGTPGMSGRELTYTTAYIELIYTFYRLFGRGMRQITDYIEGLRLGCAESPLRKGLHLRSGQQDEVGGLYRGRVI